MFRRSGKVLFLLLCVMLILAGCAADSGGEADVPEDLPVFTLEDLAGYDGKDGNKAYIAVDGLVYDVTEVSSWMGGDHNGFTAGADQTEALESRAPHGAGQLNGVPVVGRLEE